jgi:hypothetical protein
MKRKFRSLLQRRSGLNKKEQTPTGVITGIDLKKNGVKVKVTGMEQRIALD